MKNVCSFLLFLLISNVVFGQIEWVGNHEFSEFGVDIKHTLQNQQILSLGAGFTVFDSLGNIVYDNKLGFYQRSELVELHDTSFLLFAEFFACDLIVAEMIKFDKDWNMSWNSNAPFGVRQVDKFSDNSILILTENLQRMDTNGVVYWDMTPSYSISDIAITVSDTVVLATNLGVVVMDGNGAVDSVYSDLKFDMVSLLPNGNFLAQSKDTLWLLAPDLKKIASYIQHGIVDVEYDEVGVYLIADAPNAYLLNDSLNLISSFQPTSHNQSFYAISPAQQGVVLGGHEKFGHNATSNSSTFIKFFESDGATINTHEDVAVLSVDKDNYPSVETGSAYTSVIIHDIKAEVKNYGTLPLNELNLNMDFGVLYIPFDCPLDQRFSKHFENLNLLPGEATLLNWGDQKLWFAGIAPSTIDLCLWTSLPNHHLETNNDNDVACTQVTVATKERLPVAFEQYFNPVADELNIALKNSMGNEQAVANIFNATGQLVQSENIVGQQQSLELSHLADGPYFLQIVAGQQVGWEKFVKY